MCCHCLNRREFLATSAMLAAGTAIPLTPTAYGAVPSEWSADSWNPDKPFLTIGKAIRIQPVLMYSLPTPREMTSWKSWGGVQTAEAADAEADRIRSELDDLKARADFGVDVLPVVHVRNMEEAEKARSAEADTIVLYPATGSGKMLTACVPDHGAIVFVRHKSGPVYYWYEALSTRYLKTDKDGPDTDKRLSIHDVVVDDPNELLWRLRGLYGAKNFLGARVVALGGAAGKYAGDAPAVARDKYKMDIVEVTYDDFNARITSALANESAMQTARAWADRYLAVPGTSLQTDREFVVNAFVLYGLFKQLMQENDTHIFTIKECMSTIIPMSKTTACLSLSVLNDEGYAAFCESDFVVVPAGILLRYITGKPVFMHNSTFPHNACVTCAHCTGPRRMDGNRYEPAQLVTHYESEYGAAPKVEMPIGQDLTFIDPEYTTGRWVGIKGTVESNPFYEICRSQQDVRIHGNWKRLLDEVRDSHWMMVYGDYLNEIGYAASRIGITWDNISVA